MAGTWPVRGSSGRYCAFMITPGTLIDREQIDTRISGAQAWRIRYASHDVNGRATESTGLVVAPAAPGTDRPVVTWCHGTTGLGDVACPSAQPDPARELTVYFSIEATRSIDFGVPGLQGFIDDGWVVCATDYQGLGTPGMHQYSVNRTNARDAVNIVHAARSMDIGAGSTLGCMGWSQGGGAAAAVAELDAEDFGDVRLVGTVPMSPAVPVIAFEKPGGLLAGLTDGKTPPDSHAVMLLAGHAAANPDLDLSNMFTSLGVSIIEGTYDTQPVHHLNDTLARLFRLKGPIIEVQAASVPQWKAAVSAGSAAARAPICPIFVCIDGFDGGTVVLVDWQTGYADAMTKLGGAVTTKTYPDDDHFSLPASCVSDARAWLTGLL